MKLFKSPSHDSFVHVTRRILNDYSSTHFFNDRLACSFSFPHFPFSHQTFDCFFSNDRVGAKNQFIATYGMLGWLFFFTRILLNTKSPFEASSTFRILPASFHCHKTILCLKNLKKSKTQLDPFSPFPTRLERLE